MLIDDPEATASIKAQYWDPMWKVSYTRDDCDVDLVMDGLQIDRSAPNKLELTKIQYEQAKEKLKADYGTAMNGDFYPGKKRDDDSYHSSSDDDTSEGEEVEIEKVLDEKY